MQQRSRFVPTIVERFRQQQPYAIYSPSKVPGPGRGREYPYTADRYLRSPLAAPVILKPAHEEKTTRKKGTQHEATPYFGHPPFPQHNAKKEKY